MLTFILPLYKPNILKCKAVSTNQSKRTNTMSQKNGCVVKISVTTSDDVSMSVSQYGLGRGKSHILTGAYYENEEEATSNKKELVEKEAKREEEEVEEVDEKEEENNDELSSLDSDEEEYWEQYWVELRKRNEDERRRPSTPPLIGRPWNIEVTTQNFPPLPPMPVEVAEATRKRIIEDYNIDIYIRNNRMREELARVKKAEQDWISAEWDAAEAGPKEKKVKLKKKKSFFCSP